MTVIPIVGRVAVRGAVTAQARSIFCAVSSIKDPKGLGVGVLAKVTVGDDNQGAALLLLPLDPHRIRDHHDPHGHSSRVTTRVTQSCTSPERCAIT